MAKHAIKIWTYKIHLRCRAGSNTVTTKTNRCHLLRKDSDTCIACEGLGAGNRHLYSSLGLWSVILTRLGRIEDASLVTAQAREFESELFSGWASATPTAGQVWALVLRTLSISEAWSNHLGISQTPGGMDKYPRGPVDHHGRRRLHVRPARELLLTPGQRPGRPRRHRGGADNDGQ